MYGLLIQCSSYKASGSFVQVQDHLEMKDKYLIWS